MFSTESACHKICFRGTFFGLTLGGHSEISPVPFFFFWGGGVSEIHSRMGAMCSMECPPPRDQSVGTPVNLSLKVLG